MMFIFLLVAGDNRPLIHSLSPIKTTSICINLSVFLDGMTVLKVISRFERAIHLTFILRLPIKNGMKSLSEIKEIV